MLTIFLALGGIALIFCLDFTPDSVNDKWIQIKVGQEILSTGHIPQTLEYAFTKSKDTAFIAHEWLPSVLFAKWYGFWGDRGFAIAKVAFGLITSCLIFLLVFQWTRNAPLSLCFAALDGLVLHYRIAMRPESFAWIFLLLALNFLSRYQQTCKMGWLFALCPIALLWANFHGSFPLIVIIPAILVTGQWIENRKSFKKYRPEKRGLELLALLSISLVCLINPYGFSLVDHVMALGHAFWLHSIIIEWVPPYTEEFIVRFREAFIFYFGYTLIFLVCLCLNYKKLKLSDYVLAAAFFLLSLTAQRHIVIFCLVTTLIAAKALQNRLKSQKAQVALSAMALVWVVGMTFYTYHFGNAVGEKPGIEKRIYLSDEARRFIETNKIEGNVINSYSVGGELIFHYFPKIKVAIDSRIDGYGLNAWNEYVSLSRDPEILAHYLKKYHIEHLILLPNDFYLFVTRTADAWPDWKVIYSDPSIVIASRPRWCPAGQECFTVAQFLNEFRMKSLLNE